MNLQDVLLQIQAGSLPSSTKEGFRLLIEALKPIEALLEEPKPEKPEPKEDES